MKKYFFWAIVCFLGNINPAFAIVDTLIEVRLDRQVDGKPVVQRAVLSTPDNHKPKTVLLFFRGGHGIPMIKAAEDRQTNYAPFFRIGRFFQAGIATVTVDCPTDEWGPVSGNRASTCLDTYRSTPRHADDVRQIIKTLRQDHGFERVFIMGHSKGTLSSLWLAVNLGNEIEGSIHSASMSEADPWGNGGTVERLPYDRIKAPAMWIHHERDSCKVTTYSNAKARAGNRLITVRGGTGKGDPCVSQYHGYDGREFEAVDGIIAWITTGTIKPFVGDP